jgi:threonylcarbamoyladenosine tRNA methylthiotransferase MtaB
MPIKFKVYSLGCKVNQYDGDKLGGSLRSAGFVSAAGKTDIAIVNSCAVTASAIAKSRAMIQKARKENPRAKIILSGCWARIREGDLKKMKVDDIWKGENYLELIRKIFQLQSAKFRFNDYTETLIKKKPKAGGENRSRYFLKVQDGCEQFCSYCIVPYARGKLRSRTIADVLDEAEAAVIGGYREIVLCGIHLGLFGINNFNKKKEEKGDSLLKLVKELTQINGLERIRLSSIEANDVNDALINFMAGERKLCRHLHIPLQSGCDKILRLMKRPYDLRYFAAKVKKLRCQMPDIAISTDVIVGFPGETEDDFVQTRKFIKKIKFSRLHVFSFSSNDKTPASKLPGRLDPLVIKKRSEILRQDGEKLSAEYEKKFQGKILPVVVENNRSSRTGKIKGVEIKGKTEYYFDVFFWKKDIIPPLPKDLIGKVVKIKVKSTTPHC